MEAQIKADLGEELYHACSDGDLDAVREYVSHQRSATPSYEPPLSSMMYVAAHHDKSIIVRYCLEISPVVTGCVMQIILINRAKETYKLLLGLKAVDVDYYIPWFGDMLSKAATRNDFEWTKLCLEAGANPNLNLVDEHTTILGAVAERASVEMAQMLLEHGAWLKDSGAIVLAAEEGKLDMVKFLLEQGADIDEIGVEHPTDPRFTEEVGSALHKAVREGHEEVVKLLLDNGANVNLKDMMGKTSMDLAEARSDQKISHLLKMHATNTRKEDN